MPRTVGFAYRSGIARSSVPGMSDALSRDTSVAAISEWPPRSVNRSASTLSEAGGMRRTPPHRPTIASWVGVAGGAYASRPPMSRGWVGAGSALRSALPDGISGTVSMNST